jgi:hypothetical protein
MNRRSASSSAFVEHSTQEVSHGQFLLRRLALVRSLSFANSRRKKMALLEILRFHGMCGNGGLTPRWVINAYTDLEEYPPSFVNVQVLI